MNKTLAVRHYSLLKRLVLVNKNKFGLILIKIPPLPVFGALVTIISLIILFLDCIFSHQITV